MNKPVKNYSRICLIASACVLALALVLSLCGLGVNYGIDFAGGWNLKYNMGATFSQDDVSAAVSAQGVSGFKVSTTGAAGTELQISIPQMEAEKVEAIRAGFEQELLAKYPTMDVVDNSISFVGPVAGRTLVQNAIVSVVLAALLMLVYIAIRFDIDSGIAAVFGLLHDVLMMLAFMVLLRNVIQMNSSFIAAMLTIVGYSINNTIVIFDRIRENNKKPGLGKLSREEVVGISVRECLGRTINTTLTTLVTIVTLYILGVDSIREFTLPIIVGIVSGVYSANMINGYVWAFLEEKQKNHKQAAKLKAKKA